MLFDKVVIYVAVMLLTVIAPYWSLLLFVLISPWNMLNDMIGWDPRLGWSLLLAVRSAATVRNPTVQRVPPLAVWATLCFIFVSFVRLRIGTRDIPAEELESANAMLLYFVGGACAAFSILKLTDSRARLVALLSVTACSLTIASGIGLLQAHSLYVPGQATNRMSGTLGNPNYFAAYLSLGATLMMLCWRLKCIGRLLALIAALTAALTCVLTFSRMGTVACFLGLALCLQMRRTERFLNWTLLVSTVIVLTVAVGLTLGYLGEIRRTITYSDDPNQANIGSREQGVEDLTRFEAVTFALEQWRKRPFWGAGLSTLAARNYIATGLYITTHDTYAQMLAGTGAVGSGLLISTIVVLVRSLCASVRRYLLPAILEFGLCCFFGDFLQSLELFVLFAVLITMLRDLGTNDGWSVTTLRSC